MQWEGGSVDLGGGVLLAAGAQARLEGGDLWLGDPHCRGSTCSRPATGVPPQCRPGSCWGHRGWGRACICWSPELPIAGIPEEFLWLVLIFWRSALIDFFFFCFYGFFPFSQESNYPNSIQNAICFETSSTVSSWWRKGHWGLTNQGNILSSLTAIYSFPSPSFLKHNYQKEELLRLILPIKTKRKKQKQKLKNWFCAFKRHPQNFYALLNWVSTEAASVWSTRMGFSILTLRHLSS